MSKYILVVDLPDDSKCEGCPALGQEIDSEGGLLNLRCEVTKRDVEEDFIATRPTDCPLIPVERVMDSVFRLDASVQYGVSTDDVASALRDELGVTE